MGRGGQGVARRSSPSSPYHVGFGNRGRRPLAAPANITAMAASRLAQVSPWLGASRILPISPRRRMSAPLWESRSVARVGPWVPSCPAGRESGALTRGLGVKRRSAEATGACRLAQQDPSPLDLGTQSAGAFISHGQIRTARPNAAWLGAAWWLALGSEDYEQSTARDPC